MRTFGAWGEGANAPRAPPLVTGLYPDKPHNFRNFIFMTSHFITLLKDHTQDNTTLKQHANLSKRLAKVSTFLLRRSNYIMENGLKDFEYGV